jgi:hypothetical protein
MKTCDECVFSKKIDSMSDHVACEYPVPAYLKMKGNILSSKIDWRCGVFKSRANVLEEASATQRSKG